MPRFHYGLGMVQPSWNRSRVARAASVSFNHCFVTSRSRAVAQKARTKFNSTKLVGQKKQVDLRTAKFFGHSSLRNLAIMMNFAHAPTQFWFGPIIVNCGSVSLIVNICNVADSFDCVSIVISSSKI